MKRYRLLRPDEIECRVQTCRKNGLSILLYKTARTDADLLDETVGTDRWQNDFKLVDGVLYGGIGVDYGDGCVWKWDAGTESNTEAEKGRASDAFKRAGFKHGIGRELYSAPFIWIGGDKCNIKENKGKYACYDEFLVKNIHYDERERIDALSITCRGKVVYDMRVPNKAPEEPAQNEPKMPEAFKCADCGEILKPYTDENGKQVGVRRWANATTEKYGRPLCLKCMAMVNADENGC